MTSIGAVTGTVPAATTAATTAATAAARTPKQEMDSDMFMSLLVTQLTNQDPSSPMDSNAMIAQTTQLAMMEKLTNLDTTGTEDFSLQMRIAASSLLGKEVSYTDATTGEAVSGIATAVSFANGVPTVTIGTASIPLDQISGIATK